MNSLIDLITATTTSLLQLALTVLPYQCLSQGAISSQVNSSSTFGGAIRFETSLAPRRRLLPNSQKHHSE